MFFNCLRLFYSVKDCPEASWLYFALASAALLQVSVPGVACHRENIGYYI